MIYKLFYIIYNAYYKDGNFKNDNPSLTVGGIFTVFLFCVFLLIFLILDWINPLCQIPKVNKPIMFLVTCFFGTIVYFIFFYKKKNILIYEKFKDNHLLNSKAAKAWGFFIVFFTMLSPIFLLMIKTKINYGWWIKFH